MSDRNKGCNCRRDDENTPLTGGLAEIQQRLPSRLFDAHVHVYETAHIGNPPDFFPEPETGRADHRSWERYVSAQVGSGRLEGALFIPFPRPNVNIVAANRYAAQIAELQGRSRALALVRPDSLRSAYEPLLDGGSFIGFKPYHVFSRVVPTYDSGIGDYLPEWCWEMADERELAILLHLVRDRALADPVNHAYLFEHCVRYPKARCILAHAARGFHTPNTVKGIVALRGLDNLWFDSSGVCEDEALHAILHEFGPRRLMWGSDFPISERIGKCVSIGDNFAWIKPERIDRHPDSPAITCHPVGVENLRAVLRACDLAYLDANDMQDVFADNALRCFGLKAQAETRTQELYERAKTVIPGGVHLLSKRPEMFAPGVWPAYAAEARGCELWDLDGRHFYDFSINGIGACLLGFRDPDVSRAVHRVVECGSMTSLNPPEEVELAEKLCQIHPWAENVRLARTGGEAAAIAVRIARATTDRSKVAVCGYHGWSDWYLAANLGGTDALRGHLLPGLDPLGVPSELRGTAWPFRYNDRDAFADIIRKHGRELAAVVMEPCRATEPDAGFLEYVRDTAHAAGALLIFDEITIGWRRIHGGAHLIYGVHPDMALFAKSLGNGHPIAAVIGTRTAMAGAHGSFISSSYWTERVGPAAALATLKKLEDTDTVGHVARIGTLIQKTLRETAAKHGLPLSVQGFPCAPAFAFDHPEAQSLKTLYAQLMLDRGFLAGSLVYVTLAMTESIVSRYADALDDTFATLARHLTDNTIKTALRGEIAHTGFRRLI